MMADDEETIRIPDDKSKRRGGGSGNLLEQHDLMAADGQSSVSSKDSLIAALQRFNFTQNELTSSQDRANSTALMLGVANHARCARMEKQQMQLSSRLAVGERALRYIQGQVNSQGNDIKQVEDKVADQDNSILSLEQRIEDERLNVQRLAKQYRYELSEQRELIKESRMELNKLMRSKVKQDFALDAVALLFAYWFARSYVGAFILGTSSSLIGSLPIVPAVLFMARSMRVFASQNGFYNNVGGTKVYLQYVLTAAKKVANSSSSNENISKLLDGTPDIVSSKTTS